MVQSPSWEANWFAASQEIPRISRNPKVYYLTHKHCVYFLCYKWHEWQKIKRLTKKQLLYVNRELFIHDFTKALAHSWN